MAITKIIDAVRTTTSLDATKLSGTLPAISGASLTGVGAWNLISTTDCSATASVTVTGLTSTYDSYVMVLSSLVPATDGDSIEIRLGDSSGIDSTNGDYAYHYSVMIETATTYTGVGSNFADSMLISAGVGSAAGEGICAIIYLQSPGDSPIQPLIHGTTANRATNSVMEGGLFFGRRVAVITMDRIYVAFLSGNIASGRVSVYGIKHT